MNLSEYLGAISDAIIKLQRNVKQAQMEFASELQAAQTAFTGDPNWPAYENGHSEREQRVFSDEAQAAILEVEQERRVWEGEMPPRPVPEIGRGNGPKTGAEPF